MIGVVSTILYSFLFKETRDVFQKVKGLTFIDTELAKTIVTKNCGLNFDLSKDVDFFFLRFTQKNLLSCTRSFQENPAVKIQKDLLELIETKLDVISKLKRVSPKDFDVMEEKDGAYVRELNRQLGLSWYKVRFESADLLPLKTRATYLNLKTEELLDLKNRISSSDLEPNPKWEFGEVSKMSINNKRMLVGIIIFSLLIYYSIFVSSPPVVWLFKK